MSLSASPPVLQRDGRGAAASAMQDLPSPLDPGEPDLSIEPVIGWRAWMLQRQSGGGLALVSPMRLLVWQPIAPIRATCGILHGGHRAPELHCLCGLYATSAFEQLPARVGGLTDPASLGVVGSIALWGRLVEHTSGYRAEFAYPDRIRLVCGACFVARRNRTPTRIGIRGMDLVPLCDIHAVRFPEGLLVPETPAEIEAELLSTYRVDVLPAEALARLGRHVAGPCAPHPFVVQTRREWQALRSSAAGRVGLIALVAVFFVLRALGIFSSAAPGDRGPWSRVPAAPVTRLAGMTTVGYPHLSDPSPRDRAQARAYPVPPALICGRLDGTTVELRRCGLKFGGPARVSGFAVSPPEHRSDCEFGTGFTRRDRFSVCWLGPIDLIALGTEELSIWQLPRVQFEEVFA